MTESERPQFGSAAEAPSAKPLPTGNGMAVAGLVLGLCALVLCWIPFLNWVLALLGIVFGGVGMSRAKQRGGRGFGLAVAGLICAVIGAAIGTWVFLTAMKSFEGYMAKGRMIEAQLQLNRMGKSLKVYYVTMGSFPSGTAPLTPATSCCTQPGRHCETPMSVWMADPVWEKLDFSVDERHRFQYSLETTTASFTARAVGDLDCDGEAITYEIKGTNVEGFPQVDRVPRVIGKD